MGTVVCCPDCGNDRDVIISGAGYAARFGGERVLGHAIQPAAPVSPGQLHCQADSVVPLCVRCGVNRVNRRRNGSWFLPALPAAEVSSAFT